MKRRVLYLLVYAFCALALLAEPLTVVAEGQDTPQNTLSPVIITEVLAGQQKPNGDAKSEFIEIFNTTDDPIDLAAQNWRILIASSKATDWRSPYRTVALTGTILPGESYVIASQSGDQRYLPNLAKDWFSYGLSAESGHVRLVHKDVDSDAIVDQVEWSGHKDGVPITPSIDGRGVFLTPKTSGLPAGSSLQRFFDESAGYSDTNNDAFDFLLAAPTPGSPTAIIQPEDPEELPSMPPVATAEDYPPAIFAMADTGSETSQPTIPASNAGLKAPLFSELLPNPASPQTDKNDEFIEMYNPNEAYFDLSGYILEVGLQTKRRYAIPDGTKIAPHAFLALFSADTKLALSNSGSQVALLDPLDRMLTTSDAYGTAKDGQAWAFAGGVWQWTTTPTPNATNVITAPASKTSGATKQTSAKSAAVGQSASVTEEDGGTAAATGKTSGPLHPGVLALVGGFALLYGAYEYRNDIRGRIKKLRANRATRATVGSSSEGRGGD